MACNEADSELFLQRELLVEPRLDTVVGFLERCQVFGRVDWWCKRSFGGGGQPRFPGGGCLECCKDRHRGHRSFQAYLSRSRPTRRLKRQIQLLQR